MRGRTLEIKKNGHSWTQHERGFVTVVRSLIYAAICAIVTSPTMELDGELQKKIFCRIPNLDISIYIYTTRMCGDEIILYRYKS